MGKGTKGKKLEFRGTFKDYQRDKRDILKLVPKLRKIKKKS